MPWGRTPEKVHGLSMPGKRLNRFSDVHASGKTMSITEPGEGMQYCASLRSDKDPRSAGLRAQAPAARFLKSLRGSSGGTLDVNKRWCRAGMYGYDREPILCPAPGYHNAVYYPRDGALLWVELEPRTVMSRPAGENPAPAPL